MRSILLPQSNLMAKLARFKPGRMVTTLLILCLIAGITQQSKASFSYGSGSYVYHKGKAITPILPGSGLDNFSTDNLPAGLVLDPVTGMISGTPTEPSAAKDYFILGHIAGFDLGLTAVVNITVLPNLDITGLTFSEGMSAPGFDQDIHNYTLYADTSVTSTKLTPLSGNPLAVTTVNGVLVKAGRSSASIPLTDGSTITVRVVSRDAGEATVNTYTYTVAKVAMPTLGGLVLDPNIVKSKVAGPHYRDYTATVENSVSSVKLIATAPDPAAIIKVNDVIVTSGVASNPIALNVGTNVITTTIQPADESITVTYSVVITRKAAQPVLTSLIFDPAITKTRVTGTNYRDYTATVKFSVSSVKVTAQPTDPLATVKINGYDVSPGMPSNPIPLSVGPNTINTEVTASDGSLAYTYSTVITRVASSNAILKKVTINENSTVVKTSNTLYTTSVDAALTQVKVKPIADEPNATVTVNDIAVARGAYSELIPLNDGPTDINIRVTAQNGTTIQNYTLTVNRNGSNNVRMRSIKLNPNVTVTATSASNYAATVSAETLSVLIKPTTESPYTTITISSNTVPSGTYSGSLNLNPGINHFDIIVTAQDGTTTQTYGLNIFNETPPDSPSFARSMAKESILSEVSVNTALSPNGDGINDYLSVAGIEAYPKNSLTVISSKGATVFSAANYNNITNVFNGRSKSGTLPQGTYYYVLQYSNGTQALSKKGYIVIKY